MVSFKNGLKFIVGFAVLLVFQLTWAISREMYDLVTLETKANAVTTRSNEMVPLEHYEIPLSLVEADIAERANPIFVKALVFNKNGEKYVRWILNPEDTQWHQDVADFLLRNNINPEKKKYFQGYMTASRSYIVVDPQTGAEFSFKGSTNRTGGNWHNKKQTWEDGKQIRMMTDFVHSQLAKQPRLEHIVLLDEPMAFGIKALDQGMVIRSYEGLTHSGKRYVPGFSIMHEKTGAALALDNGSRDPAAYWNEHYNKPLARALAEFMALTGMTYDSPHSQNFLVELTAENRPTGKIVLRDFGDTYISSEFFTAIQRTDILRTWEKGNVLSKYLSSGVGILHGNTPPRWINMVRNSLKNKSYFQWGRDFYKEFQKELLRQTGVEFTPLGAYPVREDNYFSQRYDLLDEAGQKFIDLVSRGRQRNQLMTQYCAYIFQ